MAASKSAEQAQAIEAAAKIPTKSLPKGAALVGGSVGGELAVYARDDAEVLSLICLRPDGSPLVLFENRRKWVPFGGAQGATP